MCVLCMCTVYGVQGERQGGGVASPPLDSIIYCVRQDVSAPGRTGAGEAAARRAPARDGASSPPHRHTQDQAVRPWLAQGDAGQSSSFSFSCQ
jgi:hypothetical protein